MTWRVVMRIAAAALIVCGVSLATTRAYAAWIDAPPSGNPGQLVLATEPFPTNVGRLAAGESASWMIQARLADARSSSLSLQLRGWGELVEHANGLTVRVDACEVPFAGEGSESLCPGGAVPVVEIARLGSIATDAGSDTWPLADLAVDAPRYLRVTLGVPGGAENDGSLQGLAGNFAVGLYAAGDSSAARPVPPGSPPSGLAESGIDVLAALLVAGGAVLLGTTTRGRDRRARGAVGGSAGGSNGGAA